MAALIDADIIAYIAGAVTQKSIDWEDGKGVHVIANLSEAHRAFDQTVASWSAATGEDDVILVWTDREKPTFRYKVHPHYKAQRTGSKPLNLRPLEDYGQKNYESECWDNLEGDDVIGIMMTDPDRGGDVMVSTDKDMKTIPGRLYVPGKSRRPGLVRPNRARWWWMMQTIMGDKADNFSGAPGAGEKRAEAVLTPDMPFSEMWDAVLAVYDDQFLKPRWTEKFLTDDPNAEAIMNARCARILHHGEYNQSTGEVKLWTP